jgi:single-stranded-DNA-specific exonuclease
VLDRRGDGATAVLTDLVASGAAVLALCADVPRRIGGLVERSGGGFALCSHAALTRTPALADRFDHLVVLDPPAHPAEAAQLERGGAGTFTHLTWGPAELRFAEQIHESEYAVRAALVPLYRSLRGHGRAAGGELEVLLRGDGAHSRSVAQTARLVTILEELGLVSLDRDLPALTVLETEHTPLERSATYRAVQQRHGDGLRWLATATATPPATHA